jgi:putative transposase
LDGRRLTLSLGRDEGGKQLKLTLTLVEAVPHWVNHDHIRQCRIVKEGHLYFVIFTVERNLPNGHPLSPTKVVALDPNHKNFAYAVDSHGKATEIHTPIF